VQRRVAHKDGVLQVSFEYDPRLVEMVKGVPGRKWHPEEKIWTVPSTQVVQLVDLLYPAGFSFDASTLELYEQNKGAASDHYTVSRLNAEARAALNRTFPAPVWLVGEITGFSKSSHKRTIDFQLVDRDDEGNTLAEVNAVLFQRQRQAIEDKLARQGSPFRMEDEIAVRVQVQVDLHPEWGAYRVVIQDLDVEYTLGEAARRREEILRTLSAEGLLEKNRRLPFPILPLHVGLITSPGSDAERDVLNTLQESGYAFQVTVYPARVQGRETEPTVLRALSWFSARKELFDAVLICRGGGSRTDLGWFDSLALGREVASFPLPVVVGIGHENDRSVLDEVGWRAKTPTAAAQVLVDQVAHTLERAEAACRRALESARHRASAERERLASDARRLLQSTRQTLSHAHTELRHSRHRLLRGTTTTIRTGRHALWARAGSLPRAAHYRLQTGRSSLVELNRRLPLASANLIVREQERAHARARRLELIHPRRVLDRGYALLRLDDGRVITEPKHAPPGRHVHAELRKGILKLRSEGAGEHREGDT